MDFVCILAKLGGALGVFANNSHETWVVLELSAEPGQSAALWNIDGYFDLNLALIDELLDCFALFGVDTKAGLDHKSTDNPVLVTKLNNWDEL